MAKSSQTKRKFTRKNSGKMSRKYHKKTMWGGAEKTTKQEEKQKMTDILNASKEEIFISDKISTQPCSDPEYKEIGIVHSSESIAVNILRDIGTDFFNAFGATGFDNSIYDQLRNTCFQKLHDKISENQKICNIRVDIERDKSSIYMHVYGTLVEKIGAGVSSLAVETEPSTVDTEPSTVETEPSTVETEPVSIETTPDETNGDENADKNKQT
jgi:hypothetical protein